MWWMVIIPIIVIIGLYSLFPHKMAWWEYIIPVGVSVVTITIISFVCDYAMSAKTEFHGGWIVSAVWDEHWTETYTEIETYTDSDGKSQTRTVTKTRYHPDNYVVVDSNDYNVDIDENKFIALTSIFNNRNTEKPWRVGQSSWGDGRRFTTVWPGKDENFVPCFTSHTYKNRVARSHSIFNFKELSKTDKQTYGIYEYPDIYDFYHQNSILGWSDYNSEQQLTKANAKLGALKQVRIFIVVFQGQPLQAGIMQQNHWKNGNKNEVVVCIGTEPDGSIDWVYPFAWDNERMLVDLRENISEQKTLDMNKVVSTTVSLVEKEFRRKEFKDFDYIRLEPPTWAKVLSFIIIVFVNVGVGYVVINNETDS